LTVVMARSSYTIFIDHWKLINQELEAYDSEMRDYKHL